MTVRPRETTYSQIQRANPLLGAYMGRTELRVSALEAPDYDLAAPVITIGQESANVKRVLVQLRDTAGVDVAAAVVVRCYVSTNQKGVVSSVDTSAAISSAGTILQEEVSRGWWTILTSATGAFDLALGHAAAGTRYLNLVWLDRLYASSAITFA